MDNNKYTTALYDKNGNLIESSVDKETLDLVKKMRNEKLFTARRLTPEEMAKYEAEFKKEDELETHACGIKMDYSNLSLDQLMKVRKKLGEDFHADIDKLIATFLDPQSSSELIE